MATKEVYAALSALAYNIGDGRGNLNKLTTPTGWTELTLPANITANNPITGFTAIAYTDRKSTRLNSSHQ